MNGYLFLGLLPLAAALQLLCCRAKRRLVRVLPIIVIAVQQLLVLIWYGISGWTNWACLIILLILMVFLLCCLAVWGIYSLVKRVRR